MPGWRRCLAQYRSYLQLVLVSAAAVSLVIREWSTGVLLLVLTVVNAVVGMRQEGKAESAMNAPGKRYLDWRLDDPAGQGRAWRPSGRFATRSSGEFALCRPSWAAEAAPAALSRTRSATCRTGCGPFV